MARVEPQKFKAGDRVMDRPRQRWQHRARGVINGFTWQANQVNSSTKPKVEVSGQQAHGQAAKRRESLYASRVSADAGGACVVSIQIVKRAVRTPPARIIPLALPARGRRARSAARRGRCGDFHGSTATFGERPDSLWNPETGPQARRVSRSHRRDSRCRRGYGAASRL